MYPPPGSKVLPRFLQIIFWGQNKTLQMQGNPLYYVPFPSSRWVNHWVWGPSFPYVTSRFLTFYWLYTIDVFLQPDPFPLGIMFMDPV